MIELKDVTKRFNLKGSAAKKSKIFNAVNQINLTWRRGEFISVVGESGCGKSTLAKVIAGLTDASEGAISLDREPVHLRSQKERTKWAKTVQVVPQDPYAALNPVRKIRSSLADAFLYHKLVSRHELSHKMEELLEFVGLNARETLDKYPHQLSGGQRQRLVIARALSVNPDFLIADESVSMMDVSLRVEILDYLKRVSKERNLGLLFITHDFRVARYISITGKIAVMYLGHIVEFGQTDEILRNPMHPYTQSLISAVPLIAGRERRVEEVLPKSFEIGTLDERSIGCPFAARCPFAQADCLEQRPKLDSVTSYHQVACHYATARKMLVNE
ncbi:ABC transporter ATP-binding protein [Alicyclobacillus fastidiosus]|uniref:ABC transporter ATP-binding protein n=1 Tax=Alicyclobacillus fastidiosus TaxID=392011 RepID=A0ABY6ZEH9_9BACL|nr:ABC transporter ATP-binding protein [Alicyclobacillus fastidiosus]WAH41303.1 ABC transporter ATP-binding protein [Alicyclobacillus fastidiosus]GMA62905.1 ABC transporter ATP-binding protein [Alicyclobacillus fastidiosus]